MRNLTTALLGALLLLPLAGIPASAQQGRGNPHACVNPAGHERGWCKQSTQNGYANVATISGIALAVNGDLVQFRQDNGNTITVDQSALLRAGAGLAPGGHYTLRGSWSNNIFIAQAGPPSGYPGNGYPYGGTSSVSGVITAISGSRLTLLQGLFTTVTVDDRQALEHGMARNLFLGRSVTAYGFWSGGVFFATSIQ